MRCGGRYHVMYHEDGVEEWLTLPSLDVHLVPPAARNAAPPRPLRFWEPGDAVLCRHPPTRPGDSGGGPAEAAVYPARVEWVDAAAGRIRVSFDEDHTPPPAGEKPEALAVGVEMSLEHVRACFCHHPPPPTLPPSHPPTHPTAPLHT